MFNKKLEDALNAQINAELYSSYLYLSMSAYFESTNLLGFAHWMKTQAQEELGHALKIHSYVHEKDGRVLLKPVEGPPTDWDSPLGVFKTAYKHEQQITGLINNLTGLAIKENDHATNIFLQWFVTEQVEEEATANAIVQKLQLIGEDATGLIFMDSELGKRVVGAAAD